MRRAVSMVAFQFGAAAQPMPMAMSSAPLPGADSAIGLLPAVSAALIGIRRAKTDAKASQKTEVLSATLAGPAILATAADDLKAVGRIAELTFVEADEIAVTEIVLAEAPVE